MWPLAVHQARGGPVVNPATGPAPAVALDRHHGSRPTVIGAGCPRGLMQLDYRAFYQSQMTLMVPTMASDQPRAPTTDAAPAAAFCWPVRVYYEDTDAGGVVYHARYLYFMERARTEWLRRLGFEQDLLRSAHGVLFAVRRMSLEFLRPARFNDQLEIMAIPTSHGRASLDFAQQVRRPSDDILCCRASVNVACLEAVSLRPARIPTALLAALAATAPVTPPEPAHGC